MALSCQEGLEEISSSRRSFRDQDRGCWCVLILGNIRNGINGKRTQDGAGKVMGILIFGIPDIWRRDGLEEDGLKKGSFGRGKDWSRNCLEEGLEKRWIEKGISWKRDRLENGWIGRTGKGSSWKRDGLEQGWIGKGMDWKRDCIGRGTGKGMDWSRD